MQKLIVLFMLIAIPAIAQPLDEEPEPNWDNSLYGYEAQVAWGSKDSLVWEPVSVVSTQIMPAGYEIPDHFYGIVVVDTNRRVYWAGNTPSNEIVKIGIHLPPVPNDEWWGFYRARFRPFSLGDWSEPSRWVMVIDLSAMPVIGAFVGEVGE